MMKAAREENGMELEQVATSRRDLEKLIRQKQWEFEDLKVMKDARLILLNIILDRCSSSQYFINNCI